MWKHLPSDVRAAQAQLSDTPGSAPAPEGFIQAPRSADVGLKEPLNEKLEVEKSKSI